MKTTSTLALEYSGLQLGQNLYIAKLHRVTLLSGDSFTKFLPTFATVKSSHDNGAAVSTSNAETLET
jgi:hypothetical protein